MININIAKSKKCNSDYSLFITFDFDMKIVNVIREFPSKYWYADEKKWELPFNKLGILISKLSEYEFNITGQYVALEKKKAEMPKGFKFKTQPYEHQIECFNYGLQYDRFLLGDEMGLGKTKQVIDIAVAKKLQKGYKHCLIICGVNGLKWNWKNEVAIHSDEDAYILGQRSQKNKLVIGSNLDKLSDLSDIDKLPYFIITNIETLRYKEWTGEYAKLRNGKKVKVYRYPIAERLSELNIDMIAFDECHKAKNPDSEQGQQLLKLSASTMIAMTGTPLMNAPMDLFIILKWLGFEKHGFYSFKNHYCVMGGYGGYEVVGYKNLAELQERLNEIMLRRRKDEVLDLPEKTYIDEYVEMTDKQRKIYNEVTMDVKSNIDQIKMATNPLAELIRMRQATGYTGILSSTIQESAKLDRMEELVEEAVSNNKKVVIFSNWTQMTDVVYDRIKNKYNVAQITGETKDNERQDIVEAFQTPNNATMHDRVTKYGNIDVLIGTSGAMGTGLTLTAGSIEIFMDEPWNMALKEQCVDRCHRIGQKQNLTIYTLMCKDTIDQRVHELVEKKGAIADALVDGDITKADKAEILDFLLS